MNRRGFLQTLAAGLGLAAVDPEKLLWTPNAKTIFIPAPIIKASGTLITLSMITDEALRQLKNNLILASLARSSAYHGGRVNAIIGETLNIRKPTCYYA